MPSYLKTLSTYMRMIKFSHTIFALPLALIAFLLALPLSKFYLTPSGIEFLSLLIKIIVCMICLRSAAMGFNRLVDNKIDQANPRTSQREIPAGQISIRHAGIFITIFTILFIITAASINLLCFYLTPVAILVVFSYSYTKRFTWLCHFFLGLAIGLAPSAAWVAVLERIDLLPLYWSGGLMFYIAGFDILYACQDAGFDKKARLHSIPARFGIRRALWVARASHLVSIAFFIWAGLENQAEIYFWAGILVTLLLFLGEHWLVRSDKLDHINIAFFHINAMVSTVLFVGVCLDLYARNKMPYLLNLFVF